MAIWSSEIKELEKLYESIKGQSPALEKELERLTKADDENMILLYSRRCLEVIITDLCECELKRPRKTEPLKGIIDKLHKEEKVPSYIITSMHGLNDLSTYGTHPKDFVTEQVKPVLNNLDIIIKWYLKYKEVGEGIKTKPAEAIAKDNMSRPEAKESIIIRGKRMSGLLSGAIAIILVVFAVLFFAKIIGGNNKIEELEKSIAVLPFINDSPGDSNNYVINGLWAEVINNLQTIKDLRVLSRTSTEQYKGPSKPTILEIAKKLGINYIVEASGQKLGNTFRLRVTLIKAKDKETTMWAKPYEQEIYEVKDYINMQSKIAQAIAAELKTVITPDEKQLFEKTPTANLTAYDFYQRGREEYLNYYFDRTNREALKKAEDLYRQALIHDSTYALAYTGLAWAYWDKHYLQDYLSKSFMDSVPILCDIALTYDNQLSEAFTLKGTYYSQTGQWEQAAEEFDKAIKFNPNDWMAYRGKGEFYRETDWISSIKYYHEAASINRGPELPDLLSNLGYAYACAGFPEKAKQFYEDKLKLDGDSADYYSELLRNDLDPGNLDKSIGFCIKSIENGSTNILIPIQLADYYANLGSHEESLNYYKKYIEILKSHGDKSVMHRMNRIGYAFRQNGYKEEAEYYFNEQIKYCERSAEEGRHYEQMLYTYYDLAGVYCFKGERERAYENLRIFNKKPMMSSWMVSLIKKDPLFKSIRNEPEFKQIVRDVEVKYQAEHDRVKKWLEEQGML